MNLFNTSPILSFSALLYHSLFNLSTKTMTTTITVMIMQSTNGGFITLDRDVKRGQMLEAEVEAEART